MPEISIGQIDRIEAGQGPLVLLLHASASGAKQWRGLIEALSADHRVVAPYLFGYGRTPAWTAGRPQTIEDQAALVTALVPDGEDVFAIVGHSFGGYVAMAAARDLGPRLGRLVLLEPNPFGLLKQNGRDEAFAEALGLRDAIKAHGAKGEWLLAARRFADYWSAPGTWDAMGDARRDAFAQALRPNFHEWDTLDGAQAALGTWALDLPAATLVCADPNTARPIREIVALMRAATPWTFADIEAGGHLAPMTRPDLVNPMVEAFLAA